ncbi:extracellular solute-binding protein [Spirobacillus cienkowskii]|uniref:extracellular solute-binding protein n=1 Tax=Spirobacillus cienkowskii TaxID=495820 RepID=UPI0030D23C2B
MKIFIKTIVLISMFNIPLQIFANNKIVQKEEINIYTSRHYEVDKKLYENFEKQENVKVNVLFIKEAAQIFERLKREGKHSPADVVLTVDAGSIWKAEQDNLFQPISSATIAQRLPESLRSDKNNWVAVSMRGRVIAYNKEKLKGNEIDTYENLANNNWKHKLLIRSSHNVYNQSLVAGFLNANGEKATSEWLKNVSGNLARTPEGGDTDQLLALANNVGEMAVVNTYYYARMLNSNEAKFRSAANKIGIIFPNQKNRGAHVNISTAALAKYAPNKEKAIKFIEFLLTKESQTMIMNENYEYPVTIDVEWNKTLQELGKAKFDLDGIKQIGSNSLEALKLLDKYGWR